MQELVDGPLPVGALAGRGPRCPCFPGECFFCVPLPEPVLLCVQTLLSLCCGRLWQGVVLLTAGKGRSRLSGNCAGTCGRPSSPDRA